MRSRGGFFENRDKNKVEPRAPLDKTPWPGHHPPDG
jgi:hypothetical protein